MKRNPMIGIFLLGLSTWSLWAGGMREDINERQDYGRFTEVSIRVPADVIIERDPQFRVEADVASRHRRDIEIFNDNGTLVIRPVRGGINFFRSEDIRFIIFMPQLEEVHMSSSGRLRSKHTWESDNMKIAVSGSGDIEFGGLIAEDVEIMTNGSGDISLREIETTQLNLRTTGSGDIRVEQANAAQAEIRTTGSGDTRLSIAARSIKTTQTGSGDISISGQVAEGEIKTTGSGDLKGADLLVENAAITITGSGDVSLRDGSRLTEIRITGSGSFSHH